MEISEKRGLYQKDFAGLSEAERKKTGQVSEGAKPGQEKSEEAGKSRDEAEAAATIPVPRDEYISSEKSGVKASGLYRLGRDENGNKRVCFEKAEKSAERCTTNTDKVDGEIKQLKEKQRRLEQQIRSASGDKKKARELEKKLEQVQSELSRKNNDTYRRQNALVSE